MIPQKEIMYFKGERIINISHSLGYFVFTPPKTGSMTLSHIFKNFNFQTFKLDDAGNHTFFSNNFIHTHYYNSLPNYENYKLICTVRNPYSRYVSLFKYLIGPSKEVLSTYDWRQEFYEFLFDYLNPYTEDLGYKQNTFEVNTTSLGREVDYPIRIENLYEDYTSIPFIKNSDYFTNGLLKKDLELQLNSTDNNFDYSLYKIPNKWQHFYDKSHADLVYSKHQTYFEYFGYDKNSWEQI
jgi:hypothetical protein